VILRSHSRELGSNFATEGLLSLAAESQLKENSRQGVERNNLGKRLQKSGLLGTTNYLYDGRDLVEEVDSSGNILARYTQFPSIDQPLAELRSGIASYYEQDGIGSVSALSNSAGALANTYTYDAFGKLTASTGTLLNSFQYTGREFDQETGTYQYRYRYYDPSVGRFTSEDPYGFRGGANFYRYVYNSRLA
jgi:RHS repeat-associated protein